MAVSMSKDDLTQLYEAEKKRKEEQERVSFGEDTEEAPLPVKFTIKLIGRTLLVSLGIGFIFIGVFFLFILFCVYVWFG